jgi:hypothetical protein
VVHVLTRRLGLVALIVSGTFAGSIADESRPPEVLAKVGKTKHFDGRIKGRPDRAATGS